jgi:hypothetical protein
VDDEPRKPILASDAERAATAAWLGAAYAEGRLVQAEYDRRVREAFAAVTRDQLAALTDDLPPREAEQEPEVAPARRRPPGSGDLQVGLVAGVLIGVVCIGRLHQVLAGFVAAAVLGLLAAALVWVFHDPYGHGGRRS